MAKRVNFSETNEPKKKVASKVIKIGDWLKNTAGFVEPLKPTDVIVGLAMEAITALDSNYATTNNIAVDINFNTEDLFEMEVATGTAVQAMVNGIYDVDATDSSSLDVSGAGTQFKIDQIISETVVLVKPVLLS